MIESQRAAFIAAARELRGARWRHRGRKPWAVDCVGLIELAGRAVGEQWETPKVYGREPWDNKLRAELMRYFGAPLPLSAAEPGFIALIRWTAGDPSHLAIIADHPDGGLSMIHAHNIMGVTEQRVAHPFHDCILEVYRPWPVTSYQ